MLKAILFDLDNTLIMFDEDIFYAGYIRRISRVFADIMPAEAFIERLITATRSLKKNNGQISNKDYFLAGFCRGYEDRQEELWQRFQYFYDKEYDKLEINISLPDSLAEVFSDLTRGSFTLVLASNPLFPENVQMKRLAWAGLGHVPFHLVTHIENMTFCKPRLEYYLEICDKIRTAPQNCLMVGNDPVNDMIAARVGMKTYLTDDAKEIDNSALKQSRNLSGTPPADIPRPDFEGPLAGVVHAVRELGAQP
ncbi:MAG: HAD family hydrolase [Thermodesulfobacteriota bacterium]